MIHTIHSRRYGTLVFFMPGDGGYVRLETLNLSGTLAPQICEGGDFCGSTITASPSTFARVCRRWHKQRMAALRDYPGMSYNK